MAIFSRRFTTKLNQTLAKLQEVALYLRAIAIMIIIAKTVNTLVNEPFDEIIAIGLIATAVIICRLQFFAGRSFGALYQVHITGEQISSQKMPYLPQGFPKPVLSPSQQ